jgi:hypothetical protein
MLVDGATTDNESAEHYQSTTTSKLGLARFEQFPGGKAPRCYDLLAFPPMMPGGSTNKTLDVLKEKSALPCRLVCQDVIMPIGQDANVLRSKSTLILCLIHFFHMMPGGPLLN